MPGRASDAGGDHGLVVHVVSPEGEVWSGRAATVRVPALEGALGILPGHQPLVCLVGRGTLRLHRIDAEALDVVVDGGFLSVDHDVVTVLADRVSSVADGPSPKTVPMPLTAS